MPYYEECLVNRVLPQSYLRTSKATGEIRTDIRTSAVMDSVKMLSYRSRPHKAAVGQSKIVEDITADPYAGFLRRTSERQYRESMEARGYKTRSSTSPGAKQGNATDRGHAFQLTRHTIMTRPLAVRASDRYDDKVMTGVIPRFNLSSTHSAAKGVFNGGVTTQPIPYQETAGGLAAFAQSAYSRVAPTSEVFNAATFLGELREGLPRLVPDIIQEAVRAHTVASRRRKYPPKRPRPNRNGNRMAESAGSDYLNLQFGWLPLVQDVQNAATALARATVELSQEGQRVHRKYSLPPVLSSELYQFGSETNLVGVMGGVPGLVDDLDGQRQVGYVPASTSGGPTRGTGSIHKARKLNRWFEGSFSSFYRLGFDPTSYLDRAQELVNLDITPEVLWELAPWSWLVDWNLRLGDSIRANQLTSDDRLVMHYGYAMETATYRSLHDIVPSGSSAGSYESLSHGNPMTSITTTYKRRIRANPYGFRVTTPSAFTGGQLGILGALGLTKL